ncbi:DNA-directed RNA polymerase III subunit RPC7-like, partial [Oxyura jamaicensis]|uniref:DNA-directed RNA polymerase III subunit RPC7-like n=1 Tax=Oxyura jamaicensis TaxID=8884 RepID=UPI0015A54935
GGDNWGNNWGASRGARQGASWGDKWGASRGASRGPILSHGTPQPVEYRPVPLPGGEELGYVLALKQELRGAMKNLPYFIKPGAPRRDIERYSDKYQVSSPVDGAIDWNPGAWVFFLG